MNTPLLFEVGDNDTNVDWRQGIEMYNAARRAGKQLVLLVYANEGHGLKEDNNRYDYQQFDQCETATVFISFGFGAQQTVGFTNPNPDILQIFMTQ